MSSSPHSTASAIQRRWDACGSSLAFAPVLVCAGRLRRRDPTSGASIERSRRNLRLRWLWLKEDLLVEDPQ
eukprot:Skav221575  [mRNA]  locus=scaffold1376:1019885:1024946:- [translate_table: standard]